jgi:hypothetical protein
METVQYPAKISIAIVKVVNKTTIRVRLSLAE